MSKLSFLKNIQIVATEDDKPKRRSTGSKEWNPPTGLAVRVWYDGSVYPSQELVDKFQLEYRNRPEEEKKEVVTDADGNIVETPKLLIEEKAKPFMGNGFDVLDSEDYPAFQTGGIRVLVISPAPKDAGKVNLFYTVGYNEDRTPKISVMDQGLATFGADFLVPKIEEIYGIKFLEPEVIGRDAVEEVKDEEGKIITKAKAAIAAKAEVPGVEYVDMVLVGQNGDENPEPWFLPAGKQITFFPKKMVRGEDKGGSTVVRRENPELYIFYPKQLLEESTTEENAAPAN